VLVPKSEILSNFQLVLMQDFSHRGIIASCTFCLPTEMQVAKVKSFVIGKMGV